MFTVHCPLSAQNEHKSFLSTQFSGKIGTVGSVVGVVGRVASLVLLGVASLEVLGSNSPEPSSSVGLVAGGPVVESLRLEVVLSSSRSQVLQDTGQLKGIHSGFNSH